MKKHTKIYFDYFGHDISDFIHCEICSTRAVDIHHIDQKGMGGSKEKDYIENLIALCRGCHIDAHANKLPKEYIKRVHLDNINGVL